MVEKWETHLFEYKHAGLTWCFEIKASSVADARERLAKLSHADHLGTLVLKVPAQLGFFAKFIYWLASLLR